MAGVRHRRGQTNKFSKNKKYKEKVTPRKTWDTKADFDVAYDIGLEPNGHPNTRAELRGHYVREAIFNQEILYLDFVTPEWERILTYFGWPVNTSVCIVGVGFGWAIEYLNSQGYMDVWGADNGVYIQGAKDEIDPSDGIARSLVPEHVRDENMVVPGDVSRFLRDSGHRNGPGDEEPFDVVITERVLSSLEDSEAVFLSNQIRTMNVIKSEGQVIHIENSQLPGVGDPPMNWKTLDQWKALLPNDIMVRSGGRKFL